MAGCASPPAAPPVAKPASAAAVPESEPQAAAAATATSVPHYRCDQGIAFSVHFESDSALLDAGARGRDTLLRDAGGLTPQQVVYSSRRLRAEFGLGSGGAEALLQFLEPPLVAHCRRD
ncbi:MAG TPA: hypothetical protein VLK85_02715 [Ramlibacter sp.]|nr:hypothetical protein [Ramlibacter sp.]